MLAKDAMPHPPTARETGFTSELAAWRAALATLKDNPLAGYWQLALKRRDQRQSWLRRTLPALATAVAMALIYLTVLGSNSFPTRFNEWVASAYMIVVVPTYIVWLATGVHQMARDAAFLLSRGGRKLAAPQFDELLAVSALSAHELLAGTLRVVLPALIWRALAGALLVWGGLLLLASEGFSNGGQELYHVVLLGPLTVGALFAGSVLAICCLALLAIILGHRTQHPAAVPGLAMLATLWTLFSLLLNLGLLAATMFDNGGEIQDLAAALLTALVFLGVCSVALLLALRSRLAPALYIIGIPLAAVFLLVGSLVMDASSGGMWFMSDADKLVFSCCWISGSLAPLNPQCIPSPLCWGDQELGRALINLPRLALLYGVQVVLLLLLAHHARLHLTQQRGEMS